MPPKTTRARPKAAHQTHKSFLHNLGFTISSGSRNVKLIGRDAYALEVTLPVLAGMKRLEILMQGTARRFAPDPALKQRLCILIHRAPKGLDEWGWTKFVESHAKRVEKQAMLSGNPTAHACFKRAIASPIVAGSVRIGTLKAYVTCVEVDPHAQFVSPQMRLGHVEYAAIEQAIVMSWLAGVEHTVMGPVALNRSTLHATVLDFSGIVMLAKWKYDMGRGGNYAKVLGASVAAETADARFLRKLYGTLQPASDPAGRASLVEKARQGVWKCAQSMS